MLAKEVTTIEDAREILGFQCQTIRFLLGLAVSFLVTRFHFSHVLGSLQCLYNGTPHNPQVSELTGDELIGNTAQPCSN